MLARISLAVLLIVLAQTGELHAQSKLGVAFVKVVSWPTGRALAFNVVSNLASSALYDAGVKDWLGLNATPAAPPGTSGPDPQKKPSSECTAASCKSVQDRLSPFIGIPVTPIFVPPPVQPRLPTCDNRLDGLEALRRATALDSDRAGAARDPVAAEQCYIVAANQDLPLAQYALADLYTKGTPGVPADASRARHWMQAAAERRFVPAEFALASACDEADDLECALFWYKDAGKQGDAAAQYKMAQLLYDGKRMPPDEFAAFTWLKVGVEENYPPAKETMQALIERARTDANDGMSGASLLLGKVYEVGVPGILTRDLHEAYLYYRDAADGQDRRASMAIENLCNYARIVCYDNR